MAKPEHESKEAKEAGKNGMPKSKGGREHFKRKGGRHGSRSGGKK